VTVEYGPFGVRSNVIAPGGIQGTEGIDRLMPKEFREQSEKVIPLGRLGTVEEIADCTGMAPRPLPSPQTLGRCSAGIRGDGSFYLQ